ncbi:hypothetical protein MTR67_012072 [Solanum verrucosum]|uniref:Tf2-1-like SH3-like domain-containing protein n=1 Tax=Solanum verrucosum TaxID=315347 RepID=A0AAF0Q807_SOLVR|nr:hypothetical protein MTR67_012072 [Solanum verrucosum]
MTKSAHFIPFKVSYSTGNYAKLYLREMGIDTRVKLSTTFHLQTDRQAERPIQTLEDMLRACVINFKDNWDDDLSLIEFTYNNNYPSIIGMTPFVALYARRCRSHIGCFEVGEISLIGPELVHEAMEKVWLIRKGVMRFGKKGKLSLRYVGSYHILRHSSKVAYELDLPNDLASVHPAFHVSL